MPSPYYSTIIQASTDLVNWVNIYTNTPPFTFTDSWRPISLSLLSRTARSMTETERQQFRGAALRYRGVANAQPQPDVSLAMFDGNDHELKPEECLRIGLRNAFAIWLSPSSFLLRQAASFNPSGQYK